ncbi:MAG: prepilin-type N-terminal cleavage/methylation domain-containing protein [Candidatus Shapirobacteria bacterium]|nr:prepilin-type N-terminal cleavage/methylation domain-containing protein [Candidatus Shapirobacteria bacterium]
MKLILNWRKKKGFTLVELLIVMLILAVLMIMLIGTINPVALMGRARDSGRKSDMEKIKKAFEEFYSDKGRYPHTEMIFCNLKQNCGATIPGMSGYMKECLCDGNKNPYTILADPTWFKVLTNLEDKDDKDIPKDWYTDSRYNAFFEKDKINYGVSSPNVLWYEKTLGSKCNPTTCFSTTFCNLPASGCNQERDGVSCFLNNELESGSVCNDPACRVDCCGGGCDD